MLARGAMMGMPAGPTAPSRSRLTKPPPPPPTGAPPHVLRCHRKPQKVISGKQTQLKKTSGANSALPWAGYFVRQLCSNRSISCRGGGLLLHLRQINLAWNSNEPRRCDSSSMVLMGEGHSGSESPFSQPTPVQGLGDWLRGLYLIR